MIIVMRRLLLLIALMVWQGGFMFYGAVVVPVGSEVLGSHLQQGFVTQSVTNYLNLIGAMALAVWCWDITTGRAAGGRRLRWIGWGLRCPSQAHAQRHAGQDQRATSYDEGAA